MSPDRASYDTTAESFTLDVGGRALEVYVAGPPDAPPLLFHVGTPGAGIPYRQYVDLALERGLRYVGYSRPGYGRSTRDEGRSVADAARDAVSMLDHLGAARCYTAGWSGGGPHALACAALLPDRVIGAATIAGVAPSTAQGLDWLAGMGLDNVEEFGAAFAGPDALRAYLDRVGPQVGAAQADDVADALGDLVSPVDRTALRGEFAAYLAESFRVGLAPGFDGWLDDDLAFARDWGFELASIRVPVAIWQGEQDRMVPFEHGRWLAAHVPGARAHLFPEHGHLSLGVGSAAAIFDDLVARR